MTTESQIEGTDPREDFALWFGIVGGPLIWLTQFLVAYMLVPWACSTRQHWVLHVSSLIFLIAGASPLWISARHLQSSGEKGRRHFMAILGVLLSALFVLTLIAQAIPTFFLNPCQD